LLLTFDPALKPLRESNLLPLAVIVFVTLWVVFAMLRICVEKP